MHCDRFDALLKEIDAQIMARRNAIPPGDRRCQAGSAPEGTQERRSGNERRATKTKDAVRSREEFKKETNGTD